VALGMTSLATVVLEVRDRGIGIPPERRAHLFDRFYQAHGEGYFGGLGLGLFISRQIVELHGGQIQVDFPPDGGTRFVVVLPGCVTQAPQADELPTPILLVERRAKTGPATRPDLAAPSVGA
jgi:signal transduction histidine kinase